MKNILLQSFVPARLRKTKDDGKCFTALVKFCDFSKGGIGIVYQHMGMFSVNTKRWTINAFSYMLDTIRVNSQAIFAMSKAGRYCSCMHVKFQESQVIILLVITISNDFRF